MHGPYLGHYHMGPNDLSSGFGSSEKGQHLIDGNRGENGKAKEMVVTW